MSQTLKGPLQLETSDKEERGEKTWSSRITKQQKKEKRALENVIKKDNILVEVEERKSRSVNPGFL